ncbi:lysostaphin resistance A-like protein [Halobaculum sp. MBLA0147]|uniref:CPBP family intramembrane glutamic endopeptidase n=1 Tax=Halobaculum sp. MBLA0147 TaxID=3079934 RepID=UPI0035250997
MSTASDRGLSAAVPDRATARAVLAALGLAVGGLVAGIAGVFTFSTIREAVGIAGTPVGDAFGSGIQLGFGALALVFLAVADDPRRYVGIRWPTLEDVGWTLATPVAITLVGWTFLAIQSALGVETGSHAGSEGILDVGVVFAEQPIVWVLVLGWLFLVAAPMEELLYRGIVQGRVRPHLGTAGTVLVAAAAFGLMHALPVVFGGVAEASLAFLRTAIGGVVWGYAYERTRNLAVTAVAHASVWVVNYEVVLSLV